MKLLITGICGFAGSEIARGLRKAMPDWELYGFDNFSRPGAEANRDSLTALGIKVWHADLRQASDWALVPPCDWVLDAAANPSVLAGVQGSSSSPRQLLENNLGGTLEVLEYCRRHQAGALFLSTSRVYSIREQLAIPLVVENDAFHPDLSAPLPSGVGPGGITTEFSTTPPLSLYGASKLASETMALEYGDAFDFPVWINRCGVMAGAGQFGKPDQGIFSFWIHSWFHKKHLRYLGFEGTGHQVRDCLHPADLIPLLLKQIEIGKAGERPQVLHCSGGMNSARSLRQLSAWCSERFGPLEVEASKEIRPYDLPWVVLDSGDTTKLWDWKPEQKTETIWEDIACFAEENPHWLALSLR